MKFSMHRSHTIRNGPYENTMTGAKVEIDTEVDDEFADVPTDEIQEHLSAELDALLKPEVLRALRAASDPDAVVDSHGWDYYGID